MIRICLACLSGLLLSFAVLADGIKYRLYLDADFSHATSSSKAIEMGFRAAIANADINTVRLDIIRKDHRGNSRRSLKNLKAFLTDSKALAVITGLHSPPVLSNLEFINNNRILTLDPWAAAGPITRYSKGENWVYRLSVDDSKAGGFLIRSALAEGLTKPYLVLEETGWGRSNYKNMTRAMEEQGTKISGVSWFNWSMGKSTAKNILRQAHDSGADVIMLVANTPEAVTLSEAILESDPDIRLPIRSHWGLTGGNYAERVTAEQREKLDLKFIQTRFSFLDSQTSAEEDFAFQWVRQAYPEVVVPADIYPVTGFSHGYDLGLLLMQAIRQSALTGDVVADRMTIRNELENLSVPVQGLIRLYDKPFSTFNADSPDAHEALGEEDLVLGQFNRQNQIVIEDQVSATSEE